MDESEERVILLEYRPKWRCKVGKKKKKKAKGHEYGEKF